MIKYMQDGTVNDDFAHQLDAKVRQCNEQDKKEGGEMLTIAQKRAEENKAIREQGRMEGQRETRKEDAEKMAKIFDRSVEEILEILNS